MSNTVSIPILRVFDWLEAHRSGLHNLGRASLIHKSRGTATITSIGNDKHGTFFAVQFASDGGRQNIRPGDPRNVRYWKKAIVSTTLAEKINDYFDAVQARPENIEFRALRRKYDVHGMKFNALDGERKNPDWKFFSFLQKLDNDPDWVPPEKTYSWLTKHQMSGVLAILYDRRFKLASDAWDAAKAAKNWRILRSSRNALQSTEDVWRAPHRFDRVAASAALTSRAAALRDLKRHSEAEATLRKAVAFGEDSEQIKRAWGAFDADHT